MSLDFTLEKYIDLCNAIKGLCCPIMTVKQFLEAGQPKELLIVLRHDVDRSLPSAIRMAESEAKHEIQATYYLRVTRAVFRVREISRLSRLGHEVGYHYEVLAKARGDKQRAIAMFECELKQLRHIVSVDTASMHGSPLRPWNNLDLWRTYDFGKYGLAGEASLSIDYSSLYYFTDTGRSWDAGRYNLRDRPPSLNPGQRIVSTDDLIEFLGKVEDRPVIISAHPNRWAWNWLAWGFGEVSDRVVNLGKLLVSSAQGRCSGQ